VNKERADKSRARSAFLLAAGHNEAVITLLGAGDDMWVKHPEIVLDIHFSVQDVMPCVETVKGPWNLPTRSSNIAPMTRKALKPNTFAWKFYKTNDISTRRKNMGLPFFDHSESMYYEAFSRRSVCFKTKRTKTY
jgi:hypothetical protein